MKKGGKDVVVPDSHHVSLFDEGKSLSSHKVQDQDGLGTCYANAASTVLKSVLPGNPDISYAHAAIKGSNSKSKGWKTNSKYIESNKDLYYEGGYVCETIENMKKEGGACPKDLSLTENHELFSVSVQETLYKGLGKYFDELNKVKKNPKKFDEFKKQLGLTIDQLNIKKDDIKKSCEAEKLERFPARAAMDSLFSMTLLFEDGKSACGKAKVAAIKKFMTPKSIVNTNKVVLNPNEDIVKKFQAIMEDDPEVAALMDAYIKGPLPPVDDRLALEKKLLDKMDKLLRDIVPDNDLKKCKVAQVPYSPLVPEWFTGAEVFDAMKAAKGAKCEGLFAPSNLNVISLDEQVKKDEALQCVPPTRLNKILGAIMPLMEVGMAVDATMLEGLSNPISPYANQVQKLLMPECTKEDKLIPLNDVSCESTSMCSDLAKENNEKYTGPKGKCHSLDKAKAIVRDEVISGIDEGRALGLWVCTAFMENPKVKTNFCTKKVKGIPKHGQHEMTISGYRCVDGKIEYEVLNSWGGSYCPADSDTSYKNEGIECHLDENGEPTGRFWVKEDLMVDNTVDITSVKKKP